MVLHSFYPDVVIPQQTVTDYLFSLMEDYKSKKPILRSAFEDNSYNFEEIKNAVKKCGSFLTRFGLKKGDVVALYCPNTPEYIIVFLATVACGGIITTCNPVYTTHEILHQFHDSKPKFVFTVPENFNKVKNLTSELSFCQEVIMFGSCSGFRSFNKLIKEETGNLYPRSVYIDVDKDVMALFYSSGTTGYPKGVMLSHRNFVAAITINRVGIKMLSDDTQYLVLPTFHIYGIIMSLTALAQGATLVLDQRFVLERMARAIEMYKVTWAPIVPPMLLAIAKSQLETSYDLSSLIGFVVGAAPVSPELVAAVKSKLACFIIQGWGMTETTGLASIYNHSSFGPVGASGGKLCSLNYLKVLDVATGKELGANEEGEILVNGPQVMLGYYNNPSASKAAFDEDGFLRTGDVGYFNDDQQIFVVDRLKELIKYKGFQVAPAELEHVLMSHPKIADAAVIGIPDKEAGELPKAFVVKRDGSLTAAEVLGYIEDQLSSYKRLKGGVEFVRTIPKSASGKILRRLLHNQNQASADHKPKL